VYSYVACAYEGASTPLKKRRLTADALSSSCSLSLTEDVGRPTTWQSADDQFDSRHRLLASRNLFEVRFCVFLCISCLDIDVVPEC